MRRWAVRAGALLGVAMTLLFAVFVGLSVTGPAVPAQVSPVFDLEAVRTLAGASGPTTLRTTLVSAGAQRGVFLRVGGDLAERPMPVYTVELGWDDGRTVVLEPSTDADCADDFIPASFFDPSAYARMQQAMLRADAIVATHEHFDHVCGLTRSPYLQQLAPKAVLTARQLDLTAYMTGVTADIRDRFEPLALTAPHRLAPGVVLIPAPGHSAGSLWVYIRTASREYLLVGDTVWTYEAVELAAAKPHLIALFGGEDGEAQVRYVRFLADLATDHPEVQILVAHESKQWEALLASGEMTPL